MITDKGKNIVAKYLLGQAPEFAAYLAVGTGAPPWQQSEDDPTRTRLDFEAFRVPILSKGLVNDTLSNDVDIYTRTSGVVTLITYLNTYLGIGDVITLTFTNTAHSDKAGSFTITNVNGNTLTYNDSRADASWSAVDDSASITYVKERMVFKAQLPPDQFYQMTEIGIFPAANNQLALGFDSKQMAAFLPTEGWTTRDFGPDAEPELITTSLLDVDGNFTPTTASPFFVNSNNEMFAKELVYDGMPRFMNKALMVPGNLSEFDSDAMTVSDGGSITTTNLAFDFSKNSAYDEITFCFTFAEAGAQNRWPAKARVQLSFTDSLTGIIAKKNIVLDGNTMDSAYVTKRIMLSEFTLNGDSFSWGRANNMTIKVQTLDGYGNPDNMWLVLDGVRFDNTQTQNPLYGLVSYWGGIDPAGNVVTKQENSQGYIEYRMGVSVG